MVTFLICFTLSAPPGSNSTSLQVGTAVEDITPPVPYRMSGYFSERLSTGVRDPLYAKALVISQGDVKIALVSCDIVGLALSVSDDARRQAADKTGIPIENIAIFATHSHTGPLYFGALRRFFHDQQVQQHGHDQHEKVDYPKRLTTGIVDAIVAAFETRKPRQLAVSTVKQTPQISFNRRFHMKSGPVRFNPGQLNPNIVKVAGPIDPDVQVLSVTDAKGTPQAALSVFALHLDTLGGTEYSADYPYYLEQRLQKRYGKEFVSLFGAGTCGDINHVDVTVRGRRPTDEIGNLLADNVLKAMEDRRPIQGRLKVARRILNYPLQQFSDREVKLAEDAMKDVANSKVPFLERVHTYKVLALKERGTKTAPFEVQAFRFSADVALVTLPGEVFVDFGLTIKRQSPFETTIVVELTNDTPGYVPTQKAFDEGSYETVNSRIRPGGGEVIMATAVSLLRELKKD